MTRRWPGTRAAELAAMDDLQKFLSLPVTILDSSHLPTPEPTLLVPMNADMYQSPRSTIWNALRDVMASECAASQARVDLFRRYILLAKAYRALHQATSKVEENVNLEDPDFHQRTFESLAKSNMPASLYALSRAALLKRLQRARKVGALAEICGEARLLSSKMTVERVDKISFLRIANARRSSKLDQKSVMRESD